MEIKKVTDPSFRKYGRVVEGIDFGGGNQKGDAIAGRSSL